MRANGHRLAGRGQSRRAESGGLTRFALDILLVGLFSLVAIQPLLRPTLTRSFDGTLHLHRLIELDALLRQGLLYPRWAADLVYGFGYPLFNFYAPLSYYIAAGLHLAGLSFVGATIGYFVLTTLGAGLTMYLWVRDIFGPRPAILAAAAYVYAPYHLYDNLFRASFAGVLATALFPLILWAFRRLMITRSIKYLALSSLSYAALLLAHNVSSLIFSPVLLLYVGILFITTQPSVLKHAQPSTLERALAAQIVGISVLVRRSFRAILAPGAALLLGLGLSAFFWIPALAEQQWVQLYRLTIPPDFDFRNHFPSLAELLAPPATAQAGRMNPDIENNLGLAQVALALIGSLGLWRLRHSEGRVHILWAIVILVGLVFMMLSISTPIWERVPLLATIQFPHRLLGPAMIMTALLSGASLVVLDQVLKLRAATAALWIGLALVILAGMPRLYPHDLPASSSNPGLADMMASERRTGAIGTTASGEYLPIWVTWVPPSSPMEAMYRQGRLVERLEMSSLPAGARVVQADYQATSARLTLDTPQAFRATFLTFYFPGWQAYVDDQPVPTLPKPGQGFITFDVPNGRHEIQVQFESTPVREAATWISAASLVVLLALVTWRAARRHLNPGAGPVVSLQARSFSVGETGGAALLAIGLLLFKVGYVDRHDTWFRVGFDGAHVAGVQYPLALDLGRELTLLGYNLPRATVAPGESFDLELYWKAQGPVKTNYSAFTHLIDENYNLYGQHDNLHPGGFPTTFWEPDEYAADRHPLTVPWGTPPGQYWLEVGLYNPANGKRLTILTPHPDNKGEALLIGPLTIKSARLPTLEQLNIQHRLQATFLDYITLLGYALDGDALPSGDFLRLALFWRAAAALPDNYPVTLRLVNERGVAVVERTSHPSNNRYPTTRWSPGEIVRDNHALWIPSELPAGTYRLQISLAGSEGLELRQLVKRP